MSIIGLQRRQRELGRIRMGDKGGKGQPQKLSHFRLTSAAKHLLDHAAALWGGDVVPWSEAPSEGQWQLYTKTDVLPIVVPPGPEPVTSWYEQWTGGGATHRCDGVRNHIDDKPCSCTEQTRGTPQGCKATTRVNVMLPDLPDVGVWRLETHGINAAYELPGTIEVIQMASATGRFLTGRLRIEHRTSKNAGQTRKFIVPVIDLDVTVGALMSGEVVDGHSLQLPSEEVRAANPQKSLPPGGVGVEPPEGRGSLPAGSPVVSAAQIGHLMSVAREHGVTEAALKPIVLDIAGVKSRKDIPVDRFEALLAAVRGEMVPPERQGDPS